MKVVPGKQHPAAERPGL